jgi:enoyl-CoA hydratase/carnithine racemase
VTGDVRVERRDDVIVARCCDPQADTENRFDRSLVDDLNGALDEVERAGAVGLVTIGSDRFYSNGYDLDWLATLEIEERRAFIRDHQRLLARWLVAPVPTVAALSGHAFGAGALLALAHDLRIARSDHGLFCLPEIDARIPLRRGMTALVQARLSPRAARDAVLTGHRFDASEAVDAGIADGVASGARLLEEACALARTRAATAGSTLGSLKSGLHSDAYVLLSGGSR